MNRNFLLKKIAIVLFGVVLVLLIANLIVNKVTEKGEKPKNRESLNGFEIDKIFHSSLKNYGLSDSWIIKKEIKAKQNDSLFSSYTIKVPKNLPTDLLLLEMQDLFWDDDVELKAEESSSPEKVLLKIISDKQVKLIAEFIPDENIFREYGTVSFLVYYSSEENPEKIGQLLSTPELIYLVFTPSENSKKILSNYIKSDKRYAILLDDNISELNFKLSSSYSEDRLKKSIKEIVGTFPSASFFIIDNKSDIFESANYKIIEAEFKKRNIKLVPKNLFVSLGADNMNVENKFQDFMLRLRKTDEKVLFVSTDEFLSITNLIPLYRKIGYKFIYPGDIVLRK